MTSEIALHCMKSASELKSELCEECPIYGQTGSDHCFEDALQYVIGMLEQEPRWIPVSEKLPNDRDWYLGIFKEPDTGWVNPLPFICDYVGSETKATTKEYWILRGLTDRDERIDYYFNLECVAWMPLPKPYEPQESEG